MTTLTKVLINPARRQGRKLLTDPQSMHAAVRAAFPPDLDESSGRVLWRADTNGHEHALYIVGPEKPSGQHIVEQAGWDTRPAQIAEYDRFLAAFKKGQRWHFELVANPTFAQTVEGKRSKIKAHVSVPHQLGWLYDKAGKCGFSLAPRASDEVSDQERQRWEPTEAPTVIERKTLDFRRGRSSARVHIVTARFAGVLEVTDPDLLRAALTQGIGRARGYGCGLMTLARARTNANA